MVSIVSGKTAIEIVNTLIRNKYISSHQHAADMGIELCKAELALKYNLNYVQDKDLKIKFRITGDWKDHLKTKSRTNIHVYSSILEVLNLIYSNKPS